jgi:hypothetical protein
VADGYLRRRTILIKGKPMRWRGCMKGLAPAREHSVMVVRACGRDWVIAPWKPK